MSQWVFSWGNLAMQAHFGGGQLAPEVQQEGNYLRLELVDRNAVDALPEPGPAQDNVKCESDTSMRLRFVSVPISGMLIYTA